MFNPAKELEAKLKNDESNDDDSEANDDDENNDDWLNKMYIFI